MANKRLTRDVTNYMDGQMFTTPEFAANIEKQHNMEYTAMFNALGECAFAFMATEPKDDLQNAVLHKCEWCWDTFIGVLTLVSEEAHLAAFGLTRNLFENILTTLYLTKHPEKLVDFIDHGKVVAFELCRDLGMKAEHLDPLRTEYDQLKVKFHNERGKLLPWHKENVARLFEDAGMRQMYDTYYKQGSSFAHGDAFVGTHYGTEGWYFDIANLEPEPYGRLAVVSAHSIFVDFMGELVRFYNLPFKDKWEHAHKLAKEQEERDAKR